MAKILLGCLVGSITTQGVLAITALLDFIYIAQYTTHDNNTLGYLRDALDRFYDNREYFIKVKARKDFNIPKFHSLLHYIESIELFGATDNYNTELFERLHIDFAKQGWRATNQRDEFPQMMRWLSRREKITELAICLEQQNGPSSDSSKRKKTQNMPISIAKHPNFANRNITIIEDKHKAPDFSHHLRIYMNQLNSSSNFSLPFQKLNTYNMFRFHPEILDDEDKTEEHDIVKAIPTSRDLPHGRFDTVVVMVKDTAESTGVAGLSFITELFTVVTQSPLQAQELVVFG